MNSFLQIPASYCPPAPHLSLYWFIPSALSVSTDLNLKICSYNFLICAAGVLNFFYTGCKWRITQRHGNTTATVHVNLWRLSPKRFEPHLGPQQIFSLSCPCTRLTSSFNVFNATSLPCLIFSTWQYQTHKTHKTPPLITLKVPSDRKCVFHVLELIKHGVTMPADFAGSVRSEEKWKHSAFLPSLPNLWGIKIINAANEKVHFLTLGYPN